NSWPVSEAWRSKTTLRPLIFSATLAASPLALRLLASSSAFMPSNLARLSAVARSALPRLSRKLRANPSLTRTTSPIWPSLATRSSKMTSIFVLLQVFDIWVGGLVEVSGHGQGRRLSAQEPLANSKGGVGKAKRNHQDDPWQQQQHAVGTGQPDHPALRTPGHRMKDGKAHEDVGHHERGGHDL